MAQNALFYGHYALRDAAPVDGAYPVVVLSHASGGNAPQLGWIASNFAKRGLIVIGTDHPGTRSRDGDPHRTVHIWDRPADLTFLLDWIAASALNGLTRDMARVRALGRIVIGIAGDDNICSDAGMRDRGILHEELQTEIGDFLAATLLVE